MIKERHYFRKREIIADFAVLDTVDLELSLAVLRVERALKKIQPLHYYRQIADV